MGHKQIRNETSEEGCELSSSSRTSIIYTSIHAHSSRGWFRAEGPGIRIGMFPLRRIFQLSRSLTADQRPSPKEPSWHTVHLQDNRQLSGPPPRFLSMLKRNGWHRLSHHSQYLPCQTTISSFLWLQHLLLFLPLFGPHLTKPTCQFQEQRSASPCKVPKLNHYTS